MGSNCDVMETFGRSARFVISCNKMFLFNTAGFLVFFPLFRGELHCTCHLTKEFHPNQSSCVVMQRADLLAVTTWKFREVRQEGGVFTSLVSNTGTKMVVEGTPPEPGAQIWSWIPNDSDCHLSALFLLCSLVSLVPSLPVKSNFSMQLWLHSVCHMYLDRVHWKTQSAWCSASPWSPAA